ncbi:MAG TPA: outer membrane beta-barrel family protein, partial [Bacteroidales bacterium]
AKTYCLRIKQFGYKTMVAAVPKKRGSMIDNVGVLALEPAIYNIKEVVIAGSKVRVTELPDRTVYGISGDMKKTSTDGLDVLRKVPSVQVDYFNENITVDGKTNIKIEVDGVTRDKEYLKKLHPSQVDKLEIVTSPSGKYDADVDAVINVVTIREMRYGLKGNENIQLVPNSKNTYLGRANSSLDYGLPKISYYVAANGGARKFNFFNTMERDATTNSLARIGNQPSENYNWNANTGFIYDPNDKNNFNFNVSYNGSKATSDADNFNHIYENESLTRIYETTNHSDNANSGLTTSVFYKHKFDPKTQHGYEVEANYYNSLNNDNKTRYQNIDYALDNTLLLKDPYQYEENKTKTQTAYTQANYTLPFDSVYTFGIGINGNYNQYTVDNISSLTNAPNLDYKEVRGGSFTELSRFFKKGSGKIGMRIEAANVTINSNNKNNYFSPLPYANAQYKINSRNNLKLVYSRRVIRPSSSQLNPFVSVVDSQTIRRGNINLQPAYRDNFQLTYSMKYGKSKFSGSISPQLFYEYKTRLIQNITQQDTSLKGSIYETVPMNISNGYEAGVGLSVFSQIFVVMFNSNFRYSYNHIDRYKDQIDAVNKTSWNWNSYAVCPLPYNFRFFTVLNLNGPTINGQEESRMSPFYLFGLVKQFKNSSSLNVMIFNPFTDKLFDNTTTLNTSAFYQRSESYLHLRGAIMVNYTYNFKIGKDINRQKRSSDQDIEENINKLPF